MSEAEGREARAREAAERWLAHVDAGETEAAWRESSVLFRKAVTTEDWARSLGRVHEAVGRPVEREFESAEYRTELPGAPDGHYFILTYGTRFENKARGRETVVPQLDPDGEWRVSGYWVK